MQLYYNKAAPPTAVIIPSILPIIGCALVISFVHLKKALLTLNTTAPTGAIPLTNPHNVPVIFLISDHTLGQWTNEMTNAHPIIGKILGIITAVGGAALLAAKPILLLQGAVKGATGATLLFGEASLLASAKTKIAAAAIGIWRGVVSAAQSVALAYMYATNGMSAAQMAQAVKAKAAAVAQGIWNGVMTICEVVNAAIANLKPFATERPIVITPFQMP